MKISIVIPTYEMMGRGVEFLKYNLDRILAQSFSDYEVIITDHSENDDLENLVKSYNDKRFIYIKNTEKRGICTANLNYGVNCANNIIIKPMFQDDYFYSVNALAYINRAFEKGYKWMAVGCNVSEDRMSYCRNFIPTWNDDIVYGRNTISSPSCIAYMKNTTVSWDERLRWLFDVKFYYEMFRAFGLPYFEKETLVTNFKHPCQMTELLSAQEKQEEVNLMKKEYPKNENLNQRSRWLRRKPFV